MSIINLSLFIVCGFDLLLVTLVYLRNRKSITNVSFSLYISLGAVWAISIAMFRLSNTLEKALFWDRLIYISGILTPACFLFFSQAFPREKIKIPLFYKIAYIVPVFVLTPFLFFSQLWIQEVVLTPDGNSVILGPFYTIWVIYFGIYSIWAFLILFLKYRKSEGIERLRFLYLFLALLIVMIVCLPFNIILPLFGNYKLIWIGPVTLLITLGLITFAVLKYHLFDTKVILTELLLGIMGIILASLLFLIETLQVKIMLGIVLLIFCIIGYLLIRHTYQELRAKEVLEQRVKERTKELEERTKELEERTKELEERTKELEERTRESEKKAEELERFNKLAVGRELKMTELKEKIRELEKKLENA